MEYRPLHGQTVSPLGDSKARMRAFLIAIGIFIAGGYAGLSWLATPPTIDHAGSLQQNAASSSKETSLSDTDGAAQERSSDQERSSEMAHGIDQLKATRPPAEQTATTKQNRGSPSVNRRDDTMATTPPEPGPSVGRDRFQTVGSSHERMRTASLPKGTDTPDPRLLSNVAPPTKNLRTTGDNVARWRKERLSSRAQGDPHRQRRLVEALKNPLTFDCVSCLLFSSR